MDRDNINIRIGTRYLYLLWIRIKPAWIGTIYLYRLTEDVLSVLNPNFACTGSLNIVETGHKPIFSYFSERVKTKCTDSLSYIVKLLTILCQERLVYLSNQVLQIILRHSELMYWCTEVHSEFKFSTKICLIADGLREDTVLDIADPRVGKFPPWYTCNAYNVLHAWIHQSIN